MEPHRPIHPHPELAPDPEGEKLPDDIHEYRDEVRAALVEVTRMIAVLRDAGIWEDSVFVFSSDHGELLDSGQHPMPAVGGGIRMSGHGHALYDPLIRVPLIIHIDGNPSEDRVFDGIVSHVDYLNTLSSLLGTGEVTGTADAVNWASMLRQPQTGLTTTPLNTERVVLSGSLNSGPPLRAATAGGWRYIESPTGAAPVELFDLKADPGELNNLAPMHSQQTEAARATLIEQWSRLGQSNTSGVDLDDATVRQLEALGYAE